jgi:transposase-like protein
MAIESLRPAMTTSRISREMDVPRSSIYYRRKETVSCQ